MQRTIYVLHQIGAPEHYKGLEYYCKDEGLVLKYREFSFFRQLGSSIIKRDKKKFKKSFVNMFFVFSLIFTRNHTVIIGIAPYDYLMIFFSVVSRRHNFYLHTSWPYWDKIKFDKRRLINILGSVIFSSWKLFLENRCKGIFCVSNFSKINLLKQYKITCPVQVVYHSYNEKVFYHTFGTQINIPLKFLYVGRLIPNKGINDMLELLKNIPQKNFQLGIVGWGIDQKLVEDACISFPNLKFYGRVPNALLGDIFREYDMFLLPSKKIASNDWEELFGIALVEAMACGLIPIASDHVGPSEIITSGINGFLISDENLYSEMEHMVNNLINKEHHELLQLSKNANLSVMRFQSSEIARLWSRILIID